VPGEAAWRHGEPDGERAPVAVKEDQVEVEAHAEGMDACASRQQQAGAGALAAQAGEPEQADTKANGNRDVMAEQPPPRKRAEAARFEIAAHVPTKARLGSISPPGPSSMRTSWS